LPTISVVIPTYNSYRTLSECLRSVRDQTSACEVVVVDRFSTDGTLDITRLDGVNVIEARANRSEARNIGLKLSSCPAVLFIDSDMILPPTLIEECEIALNQHDALLIPEISVGNGYWASCKSIERKLYVGNDLLEAARCFKTEKVLALGGYDPLLEAGEDWDLQVRAKRAGFSFGRVSSSIVHDEGNLRLVSLLKKKYLYGKTIGEYFRKNPAVAIRQVNPILRILNPSLKALTKHPYHAAGIFVVKTLEFTAASLGHLGKNVRR